MELVKVGEKTYYIKNQTNIGIYKIDEQNVYIIDSGNDKDAGKKILRIIEENGWKIKAIINTHSHADHIGGNKIIAERTGCDIYASKIEKAFTENTILEPMCLYGANPLKDLQNKFLYAKETNVKDVSNVQLDGLEIISLKGHSIDMIGIKTSDNVFFIGDSIISEETITKYHLFYIYDVKEYLNTLEILKSLNGNLYIPSHCEASKDILKLIDLNKNKIDEISNKILNFCTKEASFEEILKYIFDVYNLNMNPNQYVLIGSTLKSYLTYLNNENKIIYELKNNKMVWKSTNE